MKKIVTGVYKITNIVSGKSYVGSSRNIRNRIKAHFSHLNRGDHPNKHLQSSFRKYGRDAFVVTLLEECSQDELIRREQYYMDTIRPEYNYRSIASGNFGIPAWNKGLKTGPLSKEHKAKLSAAFKGRVSPTKGMKMSEETRRKISEGGKTSYTKERKEKLRRRWLGNKITLGYKHTEEAIAKISAASLKMWKTKKKDKKGK